MFVHNKLHKLLCAQGIRACARNFTVSVLGGASEVGQTLCMMLRAQPMVSKLIIHDKSEETTGIVMDLSHIPTECNLKGYRGEETLDRALKDADLVLALGAMPNKTMTPQIDVASQNKNFITTFASKLSKLKTMPFVGIAADPVNVLVPMASEILKQNGVHDQKKLFGITTLSALRAQSLYATHNHWNPRECFVPVIGGHSKDTLIPLLSQARPHSEMSGKSIQELVAKIRRSGDLLTDVKKGRPPVLSTAYSILIFTRGILDALDGRVAKINAFVENNDFGTEFFGGLVTVDYNGAGEMQRFAQLSQFEVHLLERCIEHIRIDVTKGKNVLDLAA